MYFLGQRLREIGGNGIVESVPDVGTIITLCAPLLVE
jgi:signal transduction histidine kinase